MRKALGIVLALIGLVALFMEPDVVRFSLLEILALNAIQALVIFVSLIAAYRLLRDKSDTAEQSEGVKA